MRHAQEHSTSSWAELRLRDRIGPGLRVLFVGINPGVRSAITGHHFAGFSNRFWKLLWESGLVTERMTFEDDERLPEWGYGMTNLIPRPTPGIGDLRPAEYAEGWDGLRRKISRHRPKIVALVGVTLYRALLPLLNPSQHPAPGHTRSPLGPQPFTVHGARLFVLPNPSGRNANFSYGEMLAAFQSLKRLVDGEAEAAATPDSGHQQDTPQVDRSTRRRTTHPRRAGDSRR